MGPTRVIYRLGPIAGVLEFQLYPEDALLACQHPGREVRGHAAFHAGDEYDAVPDSRFTVEICRSVKIAASLIPNQKATWLTRSGNSYPPFQWIN